MRTQLRGRLGSTIASIVLASCAIGPQLFWVPSPAAESGAANPSEPTTAAVGTLPQRPDYESSPNRRNAFPRLTRSTQTSTPSASPTIPDAANHDQEAQPSSASHPPPTTTEHGGKEEGGYPTSPQPQSPPAPPQPAPQVDEWMAVFNEMTSTLPGHYTVADMGRWGATDLNSGMVYIARRTPFTYLRSVMLHESAHVLQGRRFGGYQAAVAALAPYGGIEVTADCKALTLGATWINYGCTQAGRTGAALF